MFYDSMLIRPCAWCSKPFVVKRKDKGFCGQKCQIAAWVEANREKHNASVRAWKKANPNKCREYNRKRGKNYRKPHNVQQILERDGPFCGICGEGLAVDGWPLPTEVHIDHIIPPSKGGSMLDVNNLQLAHFVCNVKKGNRIDNLDAARHGKNDTGE